MKKSSLKWVAVGAVIGGIVIGGAAVYGWNVLSDNEKTNNTVTSNETNGTVAANTSAESDGIDTQDDRILLTLANLEQYRSDASGTPNCKEDFTSHDAEANETKTYTSEEYGFSVEVPYNADWGSDTYRLNPFDDRMDAIDDGTSEVLTSAQFGQMFVGEGCGWYRTHMLNVREPRSVDEIEAMAAKGPVVNKEVTPSTIPGLTQEAVEYDIGGLCGQPTVEIIGDEFNLVIYTLCGTGDSTADFQRLRAVASSFVLQ